MFQSGTGNGGDVDGGKVRKGRGRKDSSGTEKAFNKDELKKGGGECMKLYKRLEAAREKFNDAVKATAERSGVNAGSVKRLVVASAKGQYKDALQEAEQLVMVLEEGGEIPGGVPSEE